MPGTTQANSPDDLQTELLDYHRSLDRACRKYGITGAMFRTAKFLFYMTTLLFSGYLIEVADVEPMLSMLFAALLITGPEGVEALLVREGMIDAKNNSDDNTD